MTSLSTIDAWPSPTAAGAVIGPDGAIASHGPTTHPFALASITKLFTAAAVHLAIEEGTLGLDQEVDDRGATIADLLAHASGLAPDGSVLSEPGRRRIYSNAAYDRLADALEASAGMPFADYLHDGVFAALGMDTARLTGSPAYAAVASVDDLTRFLVGLPRLLAPETRAAMTTVYLPELVGVLPGYGRQSPNPWGLGPEIRGDKSPHWTGSTNSPATWGHFGQAGTFVWWDPEVSVGLIVLTDLAFGEWAMSRWSTLSDEVRSEVLG